MKLSRHAIFSITVVLSLVADQLTKLYARHNLVQGVAKDFIKGFWQWDLSFNPGSAFGLFSSTTGARIFLSIIAVVACGFIVYSLVKNTADDARWLTVALGLVFSGALGNLIDRVFSGVVTDFVLWHIKSTRWPTFNVADAALVAGVIILFLDIGGDQKRAKAAKAAKQSK
jgi:signal peptidase II